MAHDLVHPEASAAEILDDVWIRTFPSGAHAQDILGDEGGDAPGVVCVECAVQALLVFGGDFGEVPDKRLFDVPGATAVCVQASPPDGFVFGVERVLAGQEAAGVNIRRHGWIPCAS